MFRFYITILNLKTKLQEQNLKKILIFSSLFHLLQNGIENKIHLLQNAFVLQNEFFHSFFTIFFNKVKFFERDVNIYGKQITLFEKKKDFAKIIRIFFLKNTFFST